jgi:hypothetical protein
MVTPDLGGKHSNVAITVADNAFTDVADNTNTTIITIVRIGLIASSTKLPLAIKSVNKLAL